MRTFLINPAWDAAGVSINQSNAINKYTNWKSRHFRAVPTFGYETDITEKNYNRDEFIQLVRESDIIHFCSATHNHNGYFMDKSINWADILKGKVTIFHDYCSFPGHWRDRADAKDCWETSSRIGCSAIFSSIPQAVHIYKDCVYIPDIVDEQSSRYLIPKNRKYDRIRLGHFPTGGGNNKNTNELMEALKGLSVEINAIIPPSGGVTHEQVINTKYDMNMGFDALWREYHGMTTVENLALGVLTMCNIGDEFYPPFHKFFGNDFDPFERVKNSNDIIKCIEYYGNNLDKLKERSISIRKFMEEHWSAKNIANRIVKEYERLLGR